MVFIYSYDLMILLISSWLIFMIAIPYMTWRRYLKLKKHKFLLTQEIIEFYEGNRELSFYNYDKYRLKILTIVLSSINNISKIYLN